MPVRINIEETSQNLSARGGLVLWRETLDRLGLAKQIARALPAHKLPTGATSHRKFHAMRTAQSGRGDGFKEGPTATVKGARGDVQRVFKRPPKKLGGLGRGEPGYCNVALCKAWANAQAKFCCVMRKLMLGPLLPRITRWDKAKTVMF